MSNQIYPTNIHGLSIQVVKSPEFGTIIQTAPNGYTSRVANRNNPIWHFHLEYNYLYDSQISPNNTQRYAPYTDIQYFMGWFMSMKGGFDDFLFKDVTDFSAAGVRGGVWQPVFIYPLYTTIIDRFGHAQMVTTAGTSGTLLPNFSLTGGTTVDSSVTWTDKGLFPNGFPNAPAQLQLVNDGLGNYYSPIQRNMGGLSYEDITDLDGSVTVFANGVLQTSGYTVGGPGLAIPGYSFAGMYIAWAAPPTPPITANFNFYFRLMFEEDSQDFERWAQQLWTIGGPKSKNGAGYVKMKTSKVAVL